MDHILWLDSPADEWELATPIGNGFMGAMLHGGVRNECVQLSHEAIWAGGKQDTADPTFRDKLDRLRKTLLDDPSKADELANELFGEFPRVKSNETAGDLLIDTGIDDFTDYRRELDLYTGIARVSFESNGVNYCRESFASYPDRVICQRFTGAHSMTISYSRHERTWKDRPLKPDFTPGSFGIDSVTTDGNIMLVKGHPTVGGEPFTVAVKVVTDGELTSEGGKFFVNGANFTDLFISIGVGEEPEFPKAGYDTLKLHAVDDIFSIMNRAELDLGDQFAFLPVNKRLERLKNDENAVDPGLIALYFDFGRYLLVSSSRPGSLPANLQGVWNGYTEAPWNADYHTNINLQMNYWLAESANLSDCAKPLFDYMNNYLLESGRRTAEVNYRCRGTVVHHLSDIYGFTAAADGVWGLWQLGGAWLCYSMWEHYLYTGDLRFLKNTAYDFIHDSARFFLDYMFEKDGVMMTGPSTSPENHYLCNGKSVNLCLSPTMDIEIIGGLLKFYIKTEELLGLDPEQANEAKNALEKLPPLKIGKYGQLMEWQEDYDEPEPGHRHVSHLFALYPDCAINKSMPELMKACRKTLERRLANGGGHTGWSCAWLTALWARLGDSENVSSTLRKLFTASTRGNLLDTHPPFQIDGNFGGAAAIVEMFMQSQNGEIEFLPAIPKGCENGSFRGFVARGNKSVAAVWKDGKIVSSAVETR